MARKLKRVMRLVGAAAAVALAFGIALYLYGRPDRARAESEQYKVLSDYISAGLTDKSHDLGSDHGLVVILGRTTVTNMLVKRNRLNEYRALIARLPHARRVLPLNSQWPIINLLIANIWPDRLMERFALPVRYVLATEAETALYGTSAFEQRFPGNYGYLTFTRVGFNRNLTEAVFYTEHVCGLCGGGQYVCMRKLNGRWVVQGTAGTWIS
jgi:hypothetical protein